MVCVRTTRRLIELREPLVERTKKEMITAAQRAEIRRLFYSDRSKVGTIAVQLGLTP